MKKKQNKEFEDLDLTPLDRYTIDKIVISTILDTRRVKQEKFYPIKYRITFDSKQIYYPCMDISAEDYSALHGEVRRKDLVQCKKLTQAGFENIKKLVQDLIAVEGFSIEALTKRLSKGRKDSINVAFDNKIETLTDAGQIGTASSYQCAINSIQKFTTKDLKFSDITLDWVKKYESHLLSEEKSRTTIKFYIGCLRAIMNEAKGEIITEAQYPFGKEKFKIKKGTGRKLALTLSQIKKVLNHPLQTENERRMRDLWFFSYLCNGANFNDMLKLKYKDIAGGEIHFYRQKTIRTTENQKEISATLLPEMKAIIKKWGNPDKKRDSYLFPFLTKDMDPLTEKRTIQNVIRLCNKKMADISTSLKFDTISTYTARHSYATVLKRSGANIAFISESLGHSDLRTTENYLSSFEQDERAKNAALLTNFGK
jgi:integrase/recombinase XerD